MHICFLSKWTRLKANFLSSVPELRQRCVASETNVRSCLVPAEIGYIFVIHVLCDWKIPIWISRVLAIWKWPLVFLRIKVGGVVCCGHSPVNGDNRCTETSINSPLSKYPSMNILSSSSSESIKVICSANNNRIALDLSISSICNPHTKTVDRITFCRPQRLFLMDNFCAFDSENYLSNRMFA